MHSGIRGGFGLFRNLIQRAGGAKQARQLMESVRQVLPAAEMSGVRGISDPVRRAAVQAGLVDELTAFPSVVSQRGGNQGVLGARQITSANRPAPSQLPESIRGLFGPAVTPRPARVAAPDTAAPGVRGLSGLVQNRPPAPLAQTPTPPAPATPGPSAVPATAAPVGNQLNMFSGFNRLRYPAGTTTAEGFKVGGTTFNPADVTGRQGTEFIQSLQTRGGKPFLSSSGIDEELLLADSIKRAMGSGASVADDLYRTPIPQGTGLFSGPVSPRPAFGVGAGPAPVDPIATAAFARNAVIGAELVDLGALLNNPAIRAAFGAGGVGLFGAGVAGMMSGDRTGEITAGSPPNLPLTQAPTTPLFTELDGSPLGTVDPAVSAAPPAIGNIDPSVATPTVTTGNLQQESAIREALAQSAPGAAAVRRAVEPMSPERYRSIEEYAAAKQAYAQAEPEIQELMRFMEGQSPSIGGGLAMWAATNQPLAYQYQQRMLKNDAANQQSRETITTNKVTSPIGSQIDAAAVGNAEATADAVLDPNQGAFDRATAFAPQVQPHLRRVQDFIQQQAPRSAMYAGY